MQTVLTIDGKSAQITHLNDEILNYGLDDLLELLEDLSKKPDCDIASCRPSKVQNFFKVSFQPFKFKATLQIHLSGEVQRPDKRLGGSTSFFDVDEQFFSTLPTR